LRLEEERHQKKKKNVIHSEYGLATEPFTEDASNNIAEYTAVIKALEWTSQNSSKKGFDDDEINDYKIIVRGDSQLVIYQIQGKYKVKAARLVPLHNKVINLISKFKDIQIEWVPREKNKEADMLSNKAYQELLENDHALRKKISQHMATEKQLELLRNLGIKPEKYLSKIEARRLISKMLLRKQ
jgi:ribonuclease HI